MQLVPIRAPELQGGALYPELRVLSQWVHTLCQLKASSAAKARDSLHAMTMLCALVSCKRVLGARFVAWMRSIGELIRSSSEKSASSCRRSREERLSGPLLELHDVCLPTRVVGVGRIRGFSSSLMLPGSFQRPFRWCGARKCAML